MDIATALTFCRFMRDAAALLAWGGCVYLAAIVPPSLRRDLAPRFAPARVAAIGTAGLAVLALLPLQAGSLGDGWGDALDPSILHDLLFETTIGTAWLASAAVTIPLLLSLALPAQWRDRAAAALAGMLLATFTLTGHAAMHEGWRGLAHRANDAVHLLAGGFWLGALVPLLPTLAALRTSAHHRAAARALRRFSTIGHGAVALVIGTGLLNTALVLGHWPTDVASPYQSLLVIKVALVAVMTGLALANRYVYVPRLGQDPGGMTSRIRKATLTEIVIGLGVVALVAAFGQLEPD